MKIDEIRKRLIEFMDLIVREVFHEEEIIFKWEELKKELADEVKNELTDEVKNE